MLSLGALRQRANAVIRPGGRVFHGWWIVASSSGIQMLAGMLWMQSYSAYVVLLQEEFDWSKAVIAGAFALTRVESGILGPLQGWLVDRFGPRPILRVGTVIFGVGFILFSYVESILAFYITFALVAVGSSLGGFHTLMIAIVHWFQRRRAKAVALAQVGYSVGGLLVPLVVFSLQAFGWRATAFASGVIVMVLGLPLVQVIRHRPGPGEFPDGVAPAPDPDARSPLPPRRADHTAGEALRTPAFWLISFGHAASLLVVSAVMVHLAPHLTEGLGYSLTVSGAVIALMTASQLGGQLIGGVLGDRFEKRVICVVCMLAHTIGLLSLAFAENLFMVLAFAVVHGLGWGVRGPQMVALRADYFGAAAFGTIMGFSSLIVMLGMSAGPIVAGLMADASGSYESGFTTLAFGTLAGSLCFLAATPPARPDRRPRRGSNADVEIA